MSTTQIDDFLITYVTCPPKRKEIWNYIHWFCSTYKTAFPSQSRIAAAVGCSRQYVNQTLKWFHELGFISWMRKASIKSCIYFIADNILKLNLRDKNLFKRTVPEPGDFPPMEDDFTSELTPELTPELTQVTSKKSEGHCTSGASEQVQPKKGCFSDKKGHDAIPPNDPVMAELRADAQNHGISEKEIDILYSCYRTDPRSYRIAKEDCQTYQSTPRRWAALLINRFKSHCGISDLKNINQWKKNAG